MGYSLSGARFPTDRIYPFPIEGGAEGIYFVEVQQRQPHRTFCLFTTKASISSEVDEGYYCCRLSWWVWEIVDKHPALVRYRILEGAAAHAAAAGCVFVSLLFTAHLINCAQLIN
jgi:hypothetical protein